MKFSPEALLSQLDFPAATRRVVVAFSGGLDSTVLLHALAGVRESLPGSLVAFHVDHSLQPDSPGWAEACRKVASALDVDFQCKTIEVAPAPGASLEAAARDGRYAVFEEFLEEGDVLLTAQHADDQAETFLLQALRGAGVAGLAAMPRCRALGAGLQCRPLLPWTRAELEAWAGRQGLDWLDDPSNADNRFDRNFLRNEILPEIRKRWPAMAMTLSRAAGHCGEAAALVAEEARQLLEAADWRDDHLSITSLESLSPSRQRLLLRGWLEAVDAPAMSEAQLEEALGMLEARKDAEPEVHWSGYVLRRHRDGLHLEEDPAVAPRSGTWEVEAPFELGAGMGQLCRVASVGVGIDPAIRSVEVRYREGGERLRPLHDRHSRELKKLLQQQGVPRWQRDRLPLLYQGDRLIAVADLWVDQAVAVEGGWRVRWVRDTGPVG